MRTGKCATSEVTTSADSTATDAAATSPGALVHGQCITEEEEESNGPATDVFKTPGGPTTTTTTTTTTTSTAAKDALSYRWRIDLTRTEHHWPGWFHGLSAKFLSAPTAKMLLLAGVDRLDRDLMVGQMQGKFQMQVLPQCGHAIHEDAPDKVAEAVANFLIRNRLTTVKDTFHRYSQNWISY